MRSRGAANWMARAGDAFNGERIVVKDGNLAVIERVVVFLVAAHLACGSWVANITLPCSLMLRVSDKAKSSGKFPHAWRKGAVA